MNAVIRILKKCYKLSFLVVILFLAGEIIFPNDRLALDQLMLSFVDAFFIVPLLYMFSRRVDRCYEDWKLSKGVYKRKQLSQFWARFLYTKRNQTDMSILILLIQAILFPLFWVNVARFVAGGLVCFRLIPLDFSKWSFYYNVLYKVNSCITVPLFIGGALFRLDLNTRSAFDKRYWPREGVFKEKD